MGFEEAKEAFWAKQKELQVCEVCGTERCGEHNQPKQVQYNTSLEYGKDTNEH